MKIETFVNGRKRIFDIAPDEFLADTLKRYDYTSVRKGCDTTSCGVCTILVDDAPVASCAYLTARVAGKSITTVEGIADEAERLAGYFGDEGADQCGFCNPGIALSVHALRLSDQPFTEENIRHYLVGHLCRCSGYQAQIKAVKRYLGDAK